MTGQYHLVARLGPADKLGQLPFRFADGDPHGTTSPTTCKYSPNMDQYMVHIKTRVPNIVRHTMC